MAGALLAAVSGAASGRPSLLPAGSARVSVSSGVSPRAARQRPSHSGRSGCGSQRPSAVSCASLASGDAAPPSRRQSVANPRIATQLKQAADPRLVLRDIKLRRLGEIGRRQPRHPLLSPRSCRRYGQYCTKTQLLRMMHSPLMIERNREEWHLLASGATPDPWSMGSPPVSPKVAVRPRAESTPPVLAVTPAPEACSGAAAFITAGRLGRSTLPFGALPPSPAQQQQQPGSGGESPPWAVQQLHPQPAGEPRRTRCPSAGTRTLVTNRYDDWINPYTGTVDRGLPPNPGEEPLQLPPVRRSNVGGPQGPRSPSPVASSPRHRQARYRQLVDGNFDRVIADVLPELARRRRKESRVKKGINFMSERSVGLARAMNAFTVAREAARQRRESEEKLSRPQRLHLLLADNRDAHVYPTDELSGKDGVPLGAEVGQYLRMRAAAAAAPAVHLAQSAVPRRLSEQRLTAGAETLASRESGEGKGRSPGSRPAHSSRKLQWQPAALSPSALSPADAAGSPGARPRSRAGLASPPADRSHSHDEGMGTPHPATLGPRPSAIPMRPSILSHASHAGGATPKVHPSDLRGGTTVITEEEGFADDAVLSPLNRTQPTRMQHLQTQLAALRHPARQAELRAFVASLHPREDPVMSHSDWIQLRIIYDAVSEEHGFTEKALKAWGWTVADRHIDQATFRRIDKSRTGRIEFHELCKFFYPQMGMRDIKIAIRGFEKLEAAERNEEARRAGPSWLSRFPAHTIDEMYQIFQRFGADPETGLLSFDAFLSYLNSNDSRIPLPVEDLREIFTEDGSEHIDLERFANVIGSAFEEDVGIEEEADGPEEDTGEGGDAASRRGRGASSPRNASAQSGSKGGRLAAPGGSDKRGSKSPRASAAPP
eukprot:TRINITY_DN9531_c0_g1_i1.p1 TRINITY_DN9531_c0_g1~~TRINITY_DN9531_c0_g1_i1.p1  ORF type:complete len:910 (+),score=198.61 TRINITY_DN9531_c0_g1_i1:74-2731(+)